ncbi:MAG: hypothetical protein FWC46_05860 [Actinomycetia bacterium]|nr:hypothetical protein [Actinomycetes bacterium]
MSMPGPDFSPPGGATPPPPSVPAYPLPPPAVPRRDGPGRSLALVGLGILIGALVTAGIAWWLRPATTVTVPPPTQRTAAPPTSAPRTAVPGTAGPGGVWVWGDYAYTGRGPVNQLDPAPAALPLDGVTQVAPNMGGGLALLKDGTVWAWGSNDHMQLGTEARAEALYPQPVPGLPKDIVSIAAGYETCLAVDSSGHVWAWGANQNGRLGDGNAGGLTIDQGRAVPAVVEGPADVVQVAVGYAGVFAVTKAGDVWAWGHVDSTGLAGDGVLPPAPIPELRDVASLAAANGVAFAVTRDGSVYTWGTNGDSNCLAATPSGLGPGIPTPVPGPAVKQVAAGDGFTLLLGTDGTVRSCGDNQYGQLGDGTTTRSATPVAVRDLADVAGIAAGQIASYAMTTSGEVYAWGGNTAFEVPGAPAADAHPAPVHVDGLRGLVAIAGGPSASAIYGVQG